MSAETVFQKIHDTRAWASSETVSGFGSELSYTVHVRAALPRLFQKFHIRSVLDAPCGDMNWMREVIDNSDINYFGVDIVPQLIDGLKSFGLRKVSLKQADICNMTFPDADLWLCRDFWTHLAFRDIARSLQRFRESRIPLLLATSYVCNETHCNRDVETGGFRPVDLLKPPFRFPKPMFSIDDWVPPWPKRCLMLWHRDVIPDQTDLQAVPGLS